MERKLTKKELLKNWALTYSSETAYNYERMQALGQANAMVPVIRKLYPDDKQRQVEELKKYFVFYNTEPSFIGTMIPGLASAMEEQRANGATEITADTINGLRTGLMGPIAGIGDTVSQAIIYPLLAAISATLAIEGSFFGPIMFELVYKALLIGIGWNMYKVGYYKGKDFILSMMQQGTIKKVTEIFGMIGLMVVGGMTWLNVKVGVPIVIDIQGIELAVQSDVLDALAPGLVPLGITMLIYWIVRKKINTNYIVLAIFIGGFLLAFLGILGIPA